MAVNTRVVPTVGVNAHTIFGKENLIGKAILFNVVPGLC
jgi:hypothetical protein